MSDNSEDEGGFETLPVDVAQLRRRVLPFDAQSKAAQPRAATDEGDEDETALLPRDGSRRRLVRFDPQTGRPLAHPFWEELPAADGAGPGRT